MRSKARFTLIVIVIALAAQTGAGAQTSSMQEGYRDVLESITPVSCETHLKFLASDELAGRATPSPGLDIAALYIAIQFERIGLEPAGNDGYFQSSEWVITTVERERRLPSGETRTFRRRSLIQAGETDEPPEEGPFKLKNVVGLLPGSDPLLRDTYILVTAHYDHIGIRSGTYPDSIWNGANDNGSSTVGVIELAHALSGMNPAPRRSILFVAFFGEESGMLGSSYYADNPIVPLEKTIGVLNMEQIGRTDGDGGDQSNRGSFTGFDFSDLPGTFVEAGRELGIDVYRHEQNSIRYFMASDNRPLAGRGVPAHTFCVVFSYEDYHGAGDHWEKIDYGNMARTVRMLALGLIRLANSDSEPRWNEDNPNAERYLAAWKVLHGGG